MKDKTVCCNNVGSCGTSNAVFGLGFIGAAIYFLQQATSFWTGFIGILKALVWPAFVVYELLKFFKI
jgi:hypothetical protein